jgi:SAM-dependent methyltransferase
VKPISVCAIFRDEAPYIAEWIAYHSMIGFDHFILYDNTSQDDGSFTLLHSAFGQNATVIYWPDKPGQLAAYQHYIDHFRDRFEWTAFIDLDEFVNVLDGRTIKEVLQDYGKFSAVLVQWLLFGSSGLVSRPPGLVLDNYNMRMPEEVHGNRHVKTIARNAALVRADATPHHFSIRGAVCNARGEECVNKPIQDVGCHERLVINHYFTKSREDWILKRSKGKASTTKSEEQYPDSTFDYVASLAVERDERIKGAATALRWSLYSFVPGGEVTFAVPGHLSGLVSQVMQRPSSGQPNLPDPGIDQQSKEHLALDLIEPPGNANPANVDLLRLMPVDATAVLDVGCGTGALGASYRRLNPKARLFGIDVDPAAVAIARQHLDEVVETDVQIHPLPPSIPRNLDCIVYGDVLQHLKDPWATLRAQIQALRPGGTVLFCVPNVEHWSFLERLFQGHWNYEPSGLFDSGHLRWFTLNTLLRGLEGTGLKVVNVHRRVFEPEKVHGFVSSLAPALHNLGIDEAAYVERAAALQYIVRCTALGPEEADSMFESITDSVPEREQVPFGSSVTGITTESATFGVKVALSSEATLWSQFEVQAMDQKGHPNIEEVAGRVFSVEKTLQPPESINAQFERQFSTPARNPFFGWNPTPHAIRSFQVDDVVLDGEFRGLFNSDGFILGTGYLVPDELMQTLAIDNARLVRAGDGSTVIIGCNTAHTNHFHWCTQALPAIDTALRRLGQDRRVSIALPELNSLQEDALNLLGYAGIPRVTINDRTRQYALDRAEYSEILNGGAAFCLSEVTYRTYSRLREAVEAVSGQAEKIYVARIGARSRRMRNETAVIDEVRSRGFEVVVPDALTLTEQIRVFRSAKLVVGPHGAGMTNIVFCDPGTIVYELIPSHYANACFCNLAHICKLRYWADSFESEGDGLPNLRDWESDTRLVVERLNEIDSVGSIQSLSPPHSILRLNRAQRSRTFDLYAPDISIPGEIPPMQLVTFHNTVVFANQETEQLLHAAPNVAPPNVSVARGGVLAFLVHSDSGGERYSIRIAPQPLGEKPTGHGRMPTPAIQGFGIVLSADNGSYAFGLQSNGLFLCAEPDGRITLSRRELGPWERFRLLESPHPFASAGSDVKNIQSTGPVPALAGLDMIAAQTEPRRPVASPAKFTELVSRIWHGRDPYQGFPRGLYQEDRQGWGSQHPYLTETVERLSPQIIVEIGVWKGASSITMGNALKTNGIDGVVIAVDTWLGSWDHWLSNEWWEHLCFENGVPQIARKFYQSIISAGLQRHVLPLPLDSVNANYVIKAAGIVPDMIHIDAAHDYKAVYSDLEMWWPLLRGGGVLIGDDYAPDGGWPEVCRAFDDYFGELGLTPLEHVANKCRVTRP